MTNIIGTKVNLHGKKATCVDVGTASDDRRPMALLAYYEGFPPKIKFNWVGTEFVKQQIPQVVSIVPITVAKNPAMMPKTPVQDK